MNTIDLIGLIVLVIVANTLITIYLYPSQRPDYWWFPGAWIFFILYDELWEPIRDYIWPPPYNPNDPNMRRKLFSPPRIA